MSEVSRAIWQVLGGPANRSYSGIFLRHGVALIGPGDAGAWRADTPDSAFDGPFVRRFASELRVGDAIVLRAGAAAIAAIGLVASGYEFMPEFDDVNGWDLQHGRRMRWCPLPEPYTFDHRVFGANPGFGRVAQPEVRDFVERFLASPPAAWQTAPLPPLPAGEPPMREPPPRLAELVAQAHDLTVLYDDPAAFGELPLEDELVAHFVVPVLRALGWPPERIAVKWRRIDVAVFDSLPKSAASCRFIVEAKRRGVGVESALKQARGYLAALGVQRDVVLTDGIRYRVYGAQEDFAPVAYANLVRLKESAAGLVARLRRG